MGRNLSANDNSDNASGAAAFLPVSPHFGILDVAKSLHLGRFLGISRDNLEIYGHFPTYLIQVGGRDGDAGPHLLCAGGSAVVTTVPAKAAESSKRIEKMTRWRIIALKDVDQYDIRRVQSAGATGRIFHQQSICRVALLDSFGMFLGHALEGLPCLTTSSSIGKAQVFEMVQHHDGSVSFLGSTGRYLTARVGVGCCGAGASRTSMLSHPVGLLKDNHFHVNITRWSLIPAQKTPPRYAYKPATHLAALQEATARSHSTGW